LEVVVQDRLRLLKEVMVEIQFLVQLLLPVEGEVVRLRVMHQLLRVCPVDLVVERQEMKDREELVILLPLAPLKVIPDNKVKPILQDLVVEREEQVLLVQSFPDLQELVVMVVMVNILTLILLLALLMAL
tara:strand:+ start:302 stop:691 length:390 start_codon:yes stop_codon:yes gene_type:complete